MSSNKKYWKSVEELDENSSIVEALKNNEFVEEIPTDEFLGNGDALSSSSFSFSILSSCSELISTPLFILSPPYWALLLSK